MIIHRSLVTDFKQELMDINTISTKTDYRAALLEVSTLVDLDPSPRSSEGERLEALATQVQAYEQKHFPIEAPDPIEAIRFRMKQSGLSTKDLEPYIGQSNRVYEVLNRKRPMLWPKRLSLGFGVKRGFRSACFF